jgi:hypothetical protein
MAKALYLSTGLRNGILVTGSVKNQLDSGFVKIYYGTIPADADATLGSATLILTLTESDDGSTGLTFEGTASNGVLEKTSAESWQGTVVSAGTNAGTFYRWVLTGDTGGASTTEKRIQGTVGAGLDFDMALQSNSFTNAAVFTLPSYLLRLPSTFGFS